MTPAFLRYSAMAWEMAMMWASLNEVFRGRSAVAGGAEDDTLLGDFGIGDEVIVFADNLIDIDQICWVAG